MLREIEGKVNSMLAQRWWARMRYECTVLPMLDEIDVGNTKPSVA
jgi:hypothetical protein